MLSAAKVRATLWRGESSGLRLARRMFRRLQALTVGPTRFTWRVRSSHITSRLIRFAAIIRLCSRRASRRPGHTARRPTSCERVHAVFASRFVRGCAGMAVFASIFFLLHRRRHDAFTATRVATPSGPQRLSRSLLPSSCPDASGGCDARRGWRGIIAARRQCDRSVRRRHARSLFNRRSGAPRSRLYVSTIVRPSCVRFPRSSS